MIYAVVSSDCSHCISQVEVLNKDFFNDEYKLIQFGSKEFEEYEKIINVVPFLIIKDPSGNVKYMSAGLHEGQKLRGIEQQIRFGD